MSREYLNQVKIGKSVIKGIYRCLYTIWPEVCKDKDGLWWQSRGNMETMV